MATAVKTATRAEDVSGLEQVDQGERVELLPVGRLRPAPDNPRRQLGELAELAVSIKEVGVQQPIVARPLPDGYEVVAGARRLAAAELAGLEMVPVILRNLDEQQRVLVMAIENLQREDLTPLEEAAAYKRLLDQLDLSQRQLSDKVGKTQSHISKRMSLLELPAKVREQVDAGGIKIEDGVELAKLAGHPDHLDRALNGSPWQTLDVRVRVELDEVKLEQKIRAREEELESQAVATVRVRSMHNLPKGVHRLKTQSAGYYDAQALQVTAKQHEKHSCHAIAITDRGEEFPVCTNRKEHPAIKTLQEAERAKSASGTSTPSFKAPPENPAAKKLRQAAERRLAFVERLAAGKKPPKDALAFVLLWQLEQTLEAGDLNVQIRVAQWLGLITPVAAGGDEADEQDEDPDAVALLYQHALQGDAQLQRVAYALTLAEFEDGYQLQRFLRDGGPVRVGFTGPAAESPRRYLEHLRSQGHELAANETERLNGHAAAAETGP